MTEVEREGQALIAFTTGLAKMLAEHAEHPVSNAILPRLRNVLDQLVKALKHDVKALRQGLKTRGELYDPWALSLLKILTKVTATHHGLVAALATYELCWWTRRLDELDRGDRVDREVEKELGRGAG